MFKQSHAHCSFGFFVCVRALVAACAGLVPIANLPEHTFADGFRTFRIVPGWLMCVCVCMIPTLHHTEVFGEINLVYQIFTKIGDDNLITCPHRKVIRMQLCAFVLMPLSPVAQFVHNIKLKMKVCNEKRQDEDSLHEKLAWRSFFFCAIVKCARFLLRICLYYCCLPLFTSCK